MRDLTVRIPASMKNLSDAISSLIELVEAQVARGGAAGPSAYDSFENAVAEKIAAIECAAHEPALAALDMDAPGVVIDGKEYRRVLRSPGDYYTRSGAVSVPRTLYREGADPILTRGSRELTVGGRRSRRHDPSEPSDRVKTGHECPEGDDEVAAGEAA